MNFNAFSAFQVIICILVVAVDCHVSSEFQLKLDFPKHPVGQKTFLFKNDMTVTISAVLRAAYPKFDSIPELNILGITFSNKINANLEPVVVPVKNNKIHFLKRDLSWTWKGNVRLIFSDQFAFETPHTMGVKLSVHVFGKVQEFVVSDSTVEATILAPPPAQPVIMEENMARLDTAEKSCETLEPIPAVAFASLAEETPVCRRRKGKPRQQQSTIAVKQKKFPSSLSVLVMCGIGLLCLLGGCLICFASNLVSDKNIIRDADRHLSTHNYKLSSENFADKCQLKGSKLEKFYYESPHIILPKMDRISKTRLARSLLSYPIKIEINGKYHYFTFWSFHKIECYEGIREITTVNEELMRDGEVITFDIWDHQGGKLLRYIHWRTKSILVLHGKEEINKDLIFKNYIQIE